MGVSVVVGAGDDLPDESRQELAKLASEINDLSVDFDRAVTFAFQSAIRAGVALIAVTKIVGKYGFADWVAENTNLSRNRAYLFRRFAHHRAELEAYLAQSDRPLGVEKAMEIVRGLPAVDGNAPGGGTYPPEMIRRAVAMKESGVSQSEIAKTLGVSGSTVSYWLGKTRSDKQAKRRRDAQRRRTQAILRKHERLESANSVGGELGKAYSMVSRLEQILAKARDAATTTEARVAISVAMEQRNALVDQLWEAVQRS